MLEQGELHPAEHLTGCPACLGSTGSSVPAPQQDLPTSSRFPDQPDNPSEENCGVIRTESSGGWQNRDCGIALPYVCKKKPNATADPFLTGEWGLE